MAIIAASIEANGWVLRLRVSGTPGSFATYTLDPDGSPRVTLATTHAGFAPDGGIAVPAMLARTAVATKPLRKPVNPASPTTPVIDEADNGDGSVTVRLALSDWVHAGDTGCTLAVLAGWRSGEDGAAGIAVDNGSTLAAALPVMRWADVPYQRATGPFTLELAVFSHHPQDVCPVAGVRFSVTDGFTIRTGWATALATSTRHGDAVRVYAATIDPAGLGAGLLRCDAEVYPWLGAMRSTDPAGTRSMTALATAAYAGKAEAPHVVGYDPAGTRYAGQVLYIDPLGTTTASATLVKPDLATAKAVAPASRPATIATALQSLYLANRSMAAANGQAAAVRSADGARLVLAPGVHAGAGTTSVSTGLTTSELAAIIEGDPDDADPRVNCILQTGTAPNARITRVVLRNLGWEIGGSTLFSSALTYYWLDNVEVRGKAGSETSGTAPIAASTPAGQANLFATRSRWWRSGAGFQGVTLHFGLLRNCEWSRLAEAPVVLGGRFIPASEDATVTGVTNGVGNWSSAADAGLAEDTILAGIDLRGVRGRAWVPSPASAALAGTPNPSFRRQVFANNLCERIGSDPQPFWSMGEDSLATMSHNIVEGNSFVGERCNVMYSDPLPTTVADTDTLLNQAFGNRVANNSFDWAATKHDAFADSQSQAVRAAGGVTGANGYRPHMVETWSVTYGVGFQGNYDWGRIGSGNFRFEYFGRRGVQAVGGVPAWPADRSVLGSPATGLGSYKPPPGSPLIGRGLQASLDRDRTGAVRAVPFASGSVDASSAVPIAPDGGRSAMTATAPLLSWFALLTPGGSGLTLRSGAPVVGYTAVLAPAGGMHALSGGAPVLTPMELLLQPGTAGLALTDIGAAVLPDLIFATARLVRIEGEVRVQLINAD